MIRGDWEGSISAAAADALQTTRDTTPALAPVLAWVAVAIAFRLVVRGRWLALDVAGAGLCAAALIAAHMALGDALAADVALDHARGAVAGASRRLWLVACDLAQRPLHRRPWRTPRVTTA